MKQAISFKFFLPVARTHNADSNENKQWWMVYIIPLCMSTFPYISWLKDILKSGIINRHRTSSDLGMLFMEWDHFKMGISLYLNCLYFFLPLGVQCKWRYVSNFLSQTCSTRVILIFKWKILWFKNKILLYFYDTKYTPAWRCQV